MGMYTNIVHPVTGELFQIKTGDDNPHTYKVGSVIPWEPNPFYPGYHLDGVYEGIGGDTDDWKYVMVVIKNQTVTAVVDNGDVAKWEDHYTALIEQYGITSPDPSLWSEDAWERFREAEAKALAQHDAWETEAKDMGLTGYEYTAHLMGKLLKRKLDYNSIGKQIFSVEPLPEPKGILFTPLPTLEGEEE